MSAFSPTRYHRSVELSAREAMGLRPSLRELFTQALLARRRGDEARAETYVGEMQRRVRLAQRRMRP